MTTGKAQTNAFDQFRCLHCPSCLIGCNKQLGLKERSKQPHFSLFGPDSKRKFHAFHSWFFLWTIEFTT